MSYSDAVWERAMTVQEVILKALAGEIHWFQAADILGFSPHVFSMCVKRQRVAVGRPSESLSETACGLT